MLKLLKKYFKLSDINKTIAFVTAVSILLCMILTNPNRASAVCGSTGIPSDTLTVKVGYYGGPYYIKKVYTLNDFDKLPQVQQAYTYLDNMPAICIDSAQGVKLTDLMEDAGIDINSIQKFYFYTTDIKKGWYQCLDKGYLLDTPRYYYPNLPSKWDYETQSAPPEALSDAVLVDPIISYKDNWQRYADTPDFTVYDTSTRFRLLFGQDGTSEHNASLSAKWVHSIDVMLGGMPPSSISLDQNNIDLKVGSTLKLTATVAPDDTVDRSVRWQSSDTSVAQVDEDGVVSVVGEGTAVITVSTVVGELSAACIVNGPKENENPDAVVGSDNPQGKDNSNEDNPGDGKKPEIKQNKQPPLIKKEVKAAENNENNNDISENQGGIQPWRIYEMSVDAVPLQKQETQAIPSVFLAAAFLILFILGAAEKYLGYRREII